MSRTRGISAPRHPRSQRYCPRRNPPPPAEPPRTTTLRKVFAEGLCAFFPAQKSSAACLQPHIGAQGCSHGCSPRLAGVTRGRSGINQTAPAGRRTPAACTQSGTLTLPPPVPPRGTQCHPHPSTSSVMPKAASLHSWLQPTAPPGPNTCSSTATPAISAQTRRVPQLFGKFPPNGCVLFSPAPQPSAALPASRPKGVRPLPVTPLAAPGALTTGKKNQIPAPSVPRRGPASSAQTHSSRIARQAHAQFAAQPHTGDRLVNTWQIRVLCLQAAVPRQSRTAVSSRTRGNHVQPATKILSRFPLLAKHRPKYRCQSPPPRNLDA